MEGNIEFLKWNKPTNHWDVVKTLNKDVCYQYRNCCSYEVSIDEDPHYWCTDGFMATSQDKWNKKDFTKGFRRITPLNYTDKDVFVKNNEQKLPDNSTYWGMLCTGFPWEQDMGMDNNCLFDLSDDTCLVYVYKTSKSRKGDRGAR
ncbi:hypothetical protein CQW23_26422 [Capsicum baccatum]|uniref:G-type lectin S-receptor-like serine/threonine-protein kinase n=1 Tax=Capsicum baccatum TaxID=33114 RepID=A0A2G2VNT1_CAPBA|nr:hypothetical protein CQW23_26422 [Capsicum baccatum]